MDVHRAAGLCTLMYILFQCRGSEKLTGDIGLVGLSFSDYMIKCLAGGQLQLVRGVFLGDCTWHVFMFSSSFHVFISHV